MESQNNIIYTETNHPALFYQDMLADSVRMQRYRAAIDQVVKPGDIVADLGTGLGVLAIMAVQAGAKRVYAIDRRARVLSLAKNIIRDNRADQHIQLIEADVRDLQLDEPVDVIINELIGDFGSDEDIYACVRLFAGKNLKADGEILPKRLQTLMAPVQYQQEFRGIWCADYYGLDLSAGLATPCKPESVLHSLRHQPKQLATARVVEDIVFSNDMPERNRIIQGKFCIDTAGLLQGFVGYFDATLADTIHISNYPSYPSCHWRTWHWPVTPPKSLTPGQRIDFKLSAHINADASDWKLQWQLAT